MLFWNAIRPFIYFTILVVGSLCFLYLFDTIGGDGEYAVVLEDQVHKVRCNIHLSVTPCIAIEPQLASVPAAGIQVKAEQKTTAKPPAKPAPKAH